MLQRFDESLGDGGAGRLVMRVAVYAPMKSPDHPVPSGDRRIAQLIVAALRDGPDTNPLIASRFRSWDPGRSVRDAKTDSPEDRWPPGEPPCWRNGARSWCAPAGRLGDLSLLPQGARLDWAGGGGSDSAIPYLIIEPSYRAESAEKATGPEGLPGRRRRCLKPTCFCRSRGRMPTGWSRLRAHRIAFVLLRAVP